MRLMSMTDFVLEQKITNTLDTSQIDWYDKEVSKLEKIRSYAQFLKQPLKLGMFVPCDLDGNESEEPIPFDCSDKEYSEWCNAKERVLFKLDEHLDAIKHHISQGRTIEYLAKFNQLELTKTAVKQLGL